MSDNPTIELTPEHELYDEAAGRTEHRDPEEIVALLDEYVEENYSEETREWVERNRKNPYEGGEERDPVEKALDQTRYEQTDDALFDAIKRSSWWETRYYDGANLAKAPGVWQHRDQVPEYIRAILSKVLHERSWDWQTFDALHPDDTEAMTEVLDEVTTQPDGWTLRELTDRIQSEFGFEQDHAVGMAADTSHSLLNVAREQAYKDMEGSEDHVFDWVGPSDHRTTPTCREIKQAVEDRGGAVTMPTLQSILMQKAQKYEGTAEGGGTPQLVDDWLPHFQCRHTFVRRVRSI